MKHKIINIAEEYTKTPAGRHVDEGNYTGERFREEFLYPALMENDTVEINMDNTLGFGSSFLEEAFGGLIREKNMSLNEIKSKLQITSSRKLYPDRIWHYIEAAQELKEVA